MVYKYVYTGLIRCCSTIVLLSFMLSACGAHVFHQVRKNDTLYSISWHYNQDFRRIAEWNELDAPYTIREGQWLRVAPPEPETKQYRKPQQTTRNTAKPAPAPDKTATKPKTREDSESYSSVKHWIWPAKGEVIQKFSADTPGKQGLDISARRGAPVNAAAAGKVVYSGNGLRGYGNLIIIKHNEEFLSAYAHNQRLMVKQGDNVKQGQLIARVGNTESSQVKLHFQIRINGKPVDPLRYLP